jgi:DNA-binding YbaB/EbfC family protein
MNQQQMMQQVRKMQEQMVKAKEEVAAARVTGIAGGELVRVEISGDYRVHAVKIAKEALDPDDPETLEDLVVVALNDALTKVAQVSEEKYGALAGGLGRMGIGGL